MNRWIIQILFSSLLLSGCMPMVQAEGPRVGSSPGSVQGDLHALGTQSVESLQQLEGEEFDRAFLSQLITLRQGALDLANQVLDVAHHPETREEAGRVITSQSQDIGQMTDWLKIWYAGEPSNQHQAFMRQDLAPILEVPIQDDKLFYEMMTHHSEGVVKVSRMVEGRTERPELKELARSIRSTEAAAIERYRRTASELSAPRRKYAQ